MGITPIKLTYIGNSCISHIIFMVHVFVGGFIMPQYKFSYKTDMSINIIFTGKLCNEDYSRLLYYSPETRYVFTEFLNIFIY